SGLYHFHFRQYDPSAGVWTSEDPIGIIGGNNLYSYVGNNPVNYIDLFGLWDQSTEGGHAHDDAGDGTTNDNADDESLDGVDVSTVDLGGNGSRENSWSNGDNYGLEGFEYDESSWMTKEEQQRLYRSRKKEEDMFDKMREGNYSGVIDDFLIKPADTGDNEGPIGVLDHLENGTKKRCK
ncbi:RHS repeat-associated core domain-containing protein, partial [Desulforhopalus singaporensis]